MLSTSLSAFSHLVEQDDRVGALAHGLREHAALAEADVAGRRADEARHGVPLLELAHVDRDDEALAAEEQLGQAERGLRLADAARADEEKHAQRLLRRLEPGASRAKLAGDGGEAAVLPANAAAQAVLEVEDRLDVVLDHLADGDARPVADDRRDEGLVDVGVDEQLLGLDGLELVELRAQGGALALVAPGERLPQRVDAVDDRALLCCALARAPRGAP